MTYRLFYFLQGQGTALCFLCLPWVVNAIPAIKEKQ